MTGRNGAVRHGCGCEAGDSVEKRTSCTYRIADMLSEKGGSAASCEHGGCKIQVVVHDGGTSRGELERWVTERQRQRGEEAE